MKKKINKVGLFSALACASFFSVNVCDAEPSVAYSAVNVSVSSESSVETTFVSPGDVLVAGVEGVDAVLATEADVVTLNQVLVAGITGVTEVLAGVDDVIILDQILIAETEDVGPVLATLDDVIQLGASIAATEANVINLGDVLVDEFFAVTEVIATATDVVNIGDPLKITERNAIAVGDVLVEYVKHIPDVTAGVEDVVELHGPIKATEKHVIEIGDVLTAGVLHKDAVLATIDDVIEVDDIIFATLERHFVVGITKEEYATAVNIERVGEVDTACLTQNTLISNYNAEIGVGDRTKADLIVDVNRSIDAADVTYAVNIERIGLVDNAGLTTYQEIKRIGEVDADLTPYQAIAEINQTLDSSSYDTANTNITNNILTAGHADENVDGKISAVVNVDDIIMSLPTNDASRAATHIVINKANTDAVKSILSDTPGAASSVLLKTLNDNTNGTEVSLNDTQKNAFIKMYQDRLIVDRLIDANGTDFIVAQQLTDAKFIVEQNGINAVDVTDANFVIAHGEIDSDDTDDAEKIINYDSANPNEAITDADLIDAGKIVAIDQIVDATQLEDAKIIVEIGEISATELQDARELKARGIAEGSDDPDNLGAVKAVKEGDAIKATYHATESDLIAVDDVLEAEVMAVTEVLAEADDVVNIGDPIKATADDVIELGEVLIEGTEGVAEELATEDDVIEVGQVISATADHVVKVGDVLVAAVEGKAAVLATEDDVVNLGDAIEATEVNVIKVGDVLVAAVEGKDAVLATADDVIVLGQVLVVGVEGVEEVLATEADVVNLGDVLVAGIEAVEEVLATADDAIENYASNIGMSESEMSSMTSKLSETEKTAVITKLSELNPNTTKSDKATMAGIAFAFVSDPASKTVFGKVMDDLKNGNTTMDEINTKANSDTNSAVVGAATGITIVNNTVNVRQESIVTASGKYGLRKYSGMNSGSSSLDKGAWLKVIGSTADMGTRQSVAGYEADSHGVVIGVDKTIGDIVIGGAFSYVDTDTEGKSIANSETQTKQYQSTLYGAFLNDGHVIDGSVAYGHSTSDTSRTGLGGQVTGSFGTDIYSVGAGFSVPMDMGSWSITPKVSMSYSHVSPDEYTESGIGAKKINVKSMDLLSVQTGVTMGSKMVTDGGAIIPKLRLIADLDIAREQAVVNSSWASNGSVTPVSTGVKPSALGAIIGAGVEYASDDGAYVFSVGYDAGIRSQFISHSANAKIRVNF